MFVQSKYLVRNFTIGCFACLSNMYFNSAHPVCADVRYHQHVPARTKGAIIVILCTLHCNVFSLVNEA